MKPNRSTFAVLVALTCLAADDPNRSTERLEQLQKQLARTEFNFNGQWCSAFYSMQQFQGDAKVRLTFDPANRFALKIEFLKGEKVTVALNGHAGSVFAGDKDMLYFADYPNGDCGGQIRAFDLTTGKEVWTTQLQAVGQVQHSAYGNSITLNLSTLPGDKEGEGVVYIMGSESYGDYVEILDRVTGKQLAHRIYREGYRKQERQLQGE